MVAAYHIPERQEQMDVHSTPMNARTFSARLHHQFVAAAWITGTKLRDRAFL
jgi:hypothetical protein